jgi:hypothetical protein
MKSVVKVEGVGRRQGKLKESDSVSKPISARSFLIDVIYKKSVDGWK